MSFERFLVDIGLEEAEINEVLSTEIDFSVLKKCQKLVSDGKNCNNLIKKYAKTNSLNLELTFLRAFCRLSYEEYSLFQSLSFSYEDFVTQFRDIAIWAKEYSKNGVGLGEYNWVINSLTRKVIRLGRLQYELRWVRKTLNGKFTPKKRLVLFIHIPKDSSLDYDKVLSSIKRAKEYFGVDEFYCFSWLLDTNLQKLLDENSNIIKFQSLFNVTSKIESKQAEERVFERKDGDYKNYPENTALQKKLKAYLLNGGKTYECYGVIKKEILDTI